jgi:hypothetical protein
MLALRSSGGSCAAALLQAALSMRLRSGTLSLLPETGRRQEWSAPVGAAAAAAEDSV